MNKIKEYLNSDDFGYDTRKSLNRSNQTIDQEIISNIEKNGLTIETLKNWSYPYFVYKTQITLHGIVNEISTNYIAGYKNLILNSNGSLGIKYNAIDVEKKKEIAKYLNAVSSYRVNYDSTGWSITKTFVNPNIDELKKEYLSIPKDLLIGSAHLGSLPQIFGNIFMIIIDLQAIPSENVEKFIIHFCGANYKEKYNTVLLEKQKEHEKFEQEYEQRKKEQASKIQDEINNDTNPKINIDSIPDYNFVAYYYYNFAGTPEKRILKGVYNNNKLTVHALRETSYGKDYEKLNNIFPNNRTKKSIINEKTFQRILNEKSVFLYYVEPSQNNKGFKKDKPVETIQPIDGSNINLIDYSNKCIVISGDTKPIKDTLKELGGSFNPRLRNPLTNSQLVGWVFPKSKENILKEKLGLD